MNIQTEIDKANEYTQQWGELFFNQYVKPFCDKWNLSYNNYNEIFYFYTKKEKYIIDEDKVEYLEKLSIEDLNVLLTQDWYKEINFMGNLEFRKEFIKINTMLYKTVFNQLLCFVIPLND